MRLWLTAFVLPLLLAACVATCNRGKDEDSGPDSPSTDRTQGSDGPVDAPGGGAADSPAVEASPRQPEEPGILTDRTAPTDDESREALDGAPEPETAATALCDEYGEGLEVGKLESPSLAEASGLAASRKQSGVLWSHNDSGDSARVFAFDKSGKHLAEAKLEAAMPFDCEDLAMGPGPMPGADYIFLGDVGDNWAMRSAVFVYRFAEPAVEAGQEPATLTVTEYETLELFYPDGAHDCETVMVDPYNGDIVLVAKTAGDTTAGVFVAPAPMTPGEPTMLLEAGTIMLELATGGDISPDGTRMIIKNYFEGGIWIRKQSEPLTAALAAPRCQVPVVLEKQGEAVAFATDSSGYYTVSEFAHEPIYFYEKLTD